jgi:rhamnogalacturonan endolyase
MKRNILRRPFFGLSLALAALLSTAPVIYCAPYQMENLGRGVVAMRTSSTQVYVGWRLLGLDSPGIAFNVYRGTTKVNVSPITASTNLVDSGANLTVANTYTVRPVIESVEQAASAGFTLPANAPVQQFLSVPLQIPQGGTVPGVVTATDPNPAPVTYTYNASDSSVGDLDGDGEYEIIVKWDPSNSKDNSQSGYTGNVYLDAYKLNGTRLWRIDLGKNIRAGAHYTNFIVYDLDGDGKAEVACKTAPGTKGGNGAYLLKGPAASDSDTADYRNGSGYVLTGPEYLTVFNGQTGVELATTAYVPGRGNVGDWGDTYGNRLDRYNCSVAYLDGVRPSLVMYRGYYTRTALVAWDWRNGALTQRWHFDSRTVDLSKPDAGRENWEHMGNHQSAVIDVDGNGTDEIMFGALCINSNGSLRYTTGLGHGDAYHVGKLDPSRAGFQAFTPHEVPELYGSNASDMHDANTGALIWGKGPSTAGQDVGRGCAFDIDPTHPGSECWASNGGLYDCKGVLISSTQPSSTNFAVWWDADLSRELLNSNQISKWDWTSSTTNVLLTASECASNNGTKATPCLSGDIFGDWREEVILRTTDNTALHIYTTTIPATNRIPTLMHDRVYREAIAWQNSAYNQPPHVGFHLGTGMGAAPLPAMYLVGGGATVTADTYQAENAVLGGGTVTETTNGGFNGASYVNSAATGGTTTFNNVDGNGGGTRTLTVRYANGATPRTGNLVVNGVTTSLTFPGTGAWNTWATLSVNIALNNNQSNTIQLVTNGGDLANIDEITVL